MSPPGLANGIADALIKASPQVLFLMFGRRGILASAPLWESIIYPPLYIKIIDMGIRFLFNWKAENIAPPQKLAAYPHLYSFTSTKSVVHWFQIIRTKSFQMYDDDPPLTFGNSSRFTKVAKYPTRNIKTPIVLVYGGGDSLVDIKAMLRELPPTTVATEIPHYEHLDFLWARDVHAQVFPHVFDALDNFTNAEHSKDEYDSYRRARTVSLTASGTFWKQAAHRHAHNGSDVNDSDIASTVGSGENTPGLVNENMKRPHQARENMRGVQFSDDESTTTMTDPNEVGQNSPHASQSGADGAPERKSRSGELPSSPQFSTRGSSGSLRTLMRVGGSGGKGITIGAPKAVSGISTTDVTAAGAGQSSSDEGKGTLSNKTSK